MGETLSQLGAASAKPPPPSSSQTTVTTPAAAACRGRRSRRRRGREFVGDFLCGVGLNRYELGEGGRGGAGATDEDETNGRSMTIMNKVGLKLSPSPVTSLLWRSQIVPAAAWCDRN